MRLVVGNIDAGVAVLLSNDHYVLEVPTFMLPPDVEPGVTVDFDFRRNRDADAKKHASFAALVDRAHAALAGKPPRAPELRLVSSAAHSLSVSWSRGRCGGSLPRTAAEIKTLQMLAGSRLSFNDKRDLAFAINEPVFELLIDDQVVLSACGPSKSSSASTCVTYNSFSNATDADAQDTATVSYLDGSISYGSAENLGTGATANPQADINTKDITNDEHNKNKTITTTNNNNYEEYQDDEDDDEEDSGSNMGYRYFLEEGQHVFTGLESDTSYDVVVRITTQDGDTIFSNRLRLRTLPDHMRMPLPTSPMFMDHRSGGTSSHPGPHLHPLDMTLDAFSARSLHEEVPDIVMSGTSLASFNIHNGNDVEHVDVHLHEDVDVELNENENENQNHQLQQQQQQQKKEGDVVEIILNSDDNVNNSNETDNEKVSETRPESPEFDDVELME